MNYQVRIDERALRELSRLDKPVKSRIMSFLKERIEKSENPCLSGKALSGTLSGFWRYRVGNYRLFAWLTEETVKSLS